MKGRIFGGVKPSPHSGNGSTSTNGSSSRFGGYSYPFHYSNMFPSNSNTTRQRPPSSIIPQPPRSRQSSYIPIATSSNCGPARLYYYALMTTVASVIVIQLTLIVLWHPHFLLMQEQQHHLSGFPDHLNIPPPKGNDKTTKSTAVKIDGTHSDSSTVTTTRITKKNDDSDSLPGDVTMQVPKTDKGTDHRRVSSRTTNTVRSNSTVLSKDRNNSNNAPVTMDKKDEKNARSSTASGAKGGVIDSLNRGASFEDGNTAVRVPRNESSSLSKPTKRTGAINDDESDSMTTASSISNMTTTLVVDNTLGHTKKDNDAQQQQQHAHIIPNHVIFTHYVNLLETHEDILNEKYNEEDISLKANVLNTISLHPGAKVSFLTDEECVQAIEDAMRDIHSNDSTSSHISTATTINNTTTSTPLVKYFLKEPQGMYKADICRGAALYNIGGLYFDVDIQARMNIFSVIEPNIEFVTPTVHRKSNWLGSFFQAFIGITPRHPIMKHYLNLFVQHYDGTSRVTKGPLGVILLRRAYDIWKEESNKQQQEEVDENASKEPSSVILWEETKYNKERFPDVEPTVGKRRACHFLVAIPGTSTAVFYSRVRGSRMCGGKESIAVHNAEDEGKTKDATKMKGKTTKRDTTTNRSPESKSVTARTKIVLNQK